MFTRSRTFLTSSLYKLYSSICLIDDDFSLIIELKTILEILESNLELSDHINKFLGVVNGLDLNIKLADAYEGFEYHYQKFDGAGDFTKHGFNAEGIRRWFLGRGHDPVGWWARGDIGLTSVKSIDLNNKHLFLN